MFQAGAPVKTTYVDRLGRTIASGVEGFDGHEVIVKTEYNERGLKITDYPPFETSVGPGDWDGSVSPYPTRYSGFDALGRAATKTVVRNPLVFDPGAGDHHRHPLSVQGRRHEHAPASPSPRPGRAADP